MPATPLAAFRLGVLNGMPVWLAIIPFGMIFGVVAMGTGLDIVQVMGMTIVVAAGASQLAALQLMADDAPAILAILTGAVVNLRMAMYSATFAVAWPTASIKTRLFAAFFIHDQSFALSMRRQAEHPEERVDLKIGYFLGAGMSTICVWFVATWVGALFGARIPGDWGIEFAVPVTFIAVTAPLLRTLPHAASASVSCLLAVVFVALPGGLGLVVATVGGIATGLVAERALSP